jgi:hypothetical protein
MAMSNPTTLRVKSSVAPQGFEVIFRCMDWQQLVSLVIVAGAGALLLWGKLRRPKFNFQRETHCGCAAMPSGFSQSSIIFHARKGGRSEVRVKMK